MNTVTMFLCLRSARWPLILFFAAWAAFGGVAHMAKLHFTTALFAESWREYLLHILAGLFFGWMFIEGLFSWPRRWLCAPGRGIFSTASLMVAAPVLFLVLMHQTRYFLNDGPATLAFAAGLIAAGIAGERGIIAGIILPDSFLMLIEAGKMDKQFALGIVRSMLDMDRYSPRLFSVLAAIHQRSGEARKASVAAMTAEALAKAQPEK